MHCTSRRIDRWDIMEQKITIKIMDRTYPVNVHSPEEEEYMRKSASLLNERINALMEKNPDTNSLDIMNWVSLHLCLAILLKDRKSGDTKNQIDNLHNMLSDYLDKNEI